jgi:demethylmenaquinone methyltransferase / 2-methoxy-6-polyprenyl-1,4-benzoquinol methylase
MPKGSAIEEMFSTITQRYDEINTLLSFGRDSAWRNCVAKKVQETGATKILDLATGSGVLAFELKKLNAGAHITGVDFCQEMLDVAHHKQAEWNDNARIFFCRKDALKMSFPDGSFDAVTLAFGLRNFESQKRGLLEIFRVLKPGGHLFILEASQPASPWLRKAYHQYLKCVLPLVARIIVGKEKALAYKYLAESMSTFSDAPTLCEELSRIGFKEPKFTPFMFGAVALYETRKG